MTKTMHPLLCCLITRPENGEGGKGTLIRKGRLFERRGGGGVNWKIYGICIIVTAFIVAKAFVN